MSLAADSAEAGLWTLDPVTGVFWVTHRTRAIFGFGPDEFIDMARFQAAVHPEDWSGVRDGIERAVRLSVPVDVEYRISRAPDDRMCWIAARGQLQCHATGSTQYLMGYCIDITARKLADQFVRVSEARLAAGVELAGLGFYETDFVAGTMYADDRVRDLTGVPPEASGLQVLQFWLEHLHHDDRERMLEARERLHAGPGNRLSIEYRYQHPVRGELWIQHLAGVAARDGTGRAVRTYGVLRDITERRRSEEALRRSYEEIERLKDRLQAESDYLKAEIRVTERGIKQIDGFMSERWRIEPEYAIKVDPTLGLLGVLLEPTTVVTKAWEQVAAVGHRAFWEPRSVLITGAGPIGLLAALIARQHGLDVHVLDRVESGTKPDLVRALGATYHCGTVASVGFEPDVVIAWNSPRGRRVDLPAALRQLQPGEWPGAGGRAGSQLARLGKQPVNFVVGAGPTIASPDGGPNWRFRFMAVFLYPR